MISLTNHYKCISRQIYILKVNHKIINIKKWTDCPTQLYEYSNKYTACQSQQYKQSNKCTTLNYNCINGQIIR